VSDDSVSDLPLFVPADPVRFDGETFEPLRDEKRLGGQLRRVLRLMSDGAWRTLAEISLLTEAPESSVSARLRDARKERFGKHVVERRYLGNGLFEYRLDR